MEQKLIEIINKRTVAGFTLAEVLITLLIIGVVASIVVPALISDTQDAELHTAWRKAYSNIEQATRMIMSDNAGSIAGLCNNYNHDCIKNLYLPYLSYTKSCSYGTAAGNCWHKMGVIKWLNGNIVTTADWSLSSLILNNGSLISFFSEANCPSTSYYNRCGYIVIDVNGFKGHNTLGKDIFFIQLFKNQIKATGAQGAGSGDCDDDDTPSGNGYGCAAKYLKQ